MPYITGQGEEGSTDLTLGASWPERSPGAAAVVQGAAAQALPSPQGSRARSGQDGRPPRLLGGAAGSPPPSGSAAARPALRRHSAQLAGKAAQLRAETGLILARSSLGTRASTSSPADRRTQPECALISPAPSSESPRRCCRSSPGTDSSAMSLPVPACPFPFCPRPAGSPQPCSFRSFGPTQRAQHLAASSRCCCNSRGGGGTAPLRDGWTRFQKCLVAKPAVHLSMLKRFESFLLLVPQNLSSAATRTLPGSFLSSESFR